MWTLGKNNYGQLGDGSTSNRQSPAQVASLGDDNAAVACGFEFTAVLKSDGRVFAFGNNGDGQLGDGSTSNRNSPVQASLPAGGQASWPARELCQVAVWPDTWPPGWLVG